MKMAKVKEFFRKSKKKLVAAGAASMLSAMSVVTSFAAEGVTSTDTDFLAGATEVYNKVTTQVNIGNVVAIIGVGIAGALALMLFWWGTRKLVRMLMAAFKKGKIKV